MTTTRVPKARPAERTSARRWIALGAVCFGALMIVLDGTIARCPCDTVAVGIGAAERFMKEEST